MFSQLLHNEQLCEADGSEAQACVPFSVIIVHQPLKSGVTNHVVDSFWGVGGGGGGGGGRKHVCSFFSCHPVFTALPAQLFRGGGGGVGVGRV